MIKINEIKETTAKLYNGEDLVGEITSYVQLTDVRIQIKEKEVSGYHILWKNQMILIDKYGKLDNWPKGFFDIVDEQLDKLIDWGSSNAKS